MINFREFLTEMFDKTYDFDLVKHDDFLYVYRFYTEDNRKVIVRLGVAEIEDMDEDDIEYPLTWNLEFTVNGKLTITGEGDAFRIMATVMECMKDFAKHERGDLGVIEFSASRGIFFKESRIDLYRTLLKKFSKQYNFKFTEHNESWGAVIFRMIKE